MKAKTKVVIGGAAAGTLMAGAAAGIGTVMAIRHGLRMFRGHRLRELRGQTVLITGGSRGLGLALPAWLLLFVASIRELGASIFLMGPHSKVIGPAIVDAWITASTELSAAMALVIPASQ